MKKIISLFLSAIIIVSIAAVSVGSVSAKSKKFYANKKSVTVTSGKQKTVKITSQKGKKLTYKVSNSSICTAKFGKWKGKKITLKIIGLIAGKTKIKVTNKKTKKKITISVTVKGVSRNSPSSKTNPQKPKVNISLPKTPFDIYNYGFDDKLEDKVTITDVWTNIEYSYSGDDAFVKLYVRGTKILSDEPNTSSSCYVSWKAYDSNNIVVDSGNIITSDIKVGESFESWTYVSDLYPGKSYTIKFLDHGY